MKLTLPADDFAQALRWAIKYLDSSDDHPTVSFTVKDGVATFWHNNAYSFMSSVCPVKSLDLEDDESEDDIALVLDGVHCRSVASVVLKSMRGLDPADRNIVLTKKIHSDRSPLRIKTPNFSATIPIYRSKVSTPADLTAFAVVSVDNLFNPLSSLASICDSKASTSIPLLGVVTLTLNDESDEPAVLMSTDRYAVGEAKVPLERLGDYNNFVSEHKYLYIPAEFAGGFTPDVKDVVTLVYDEANLKFGYKSDSRVALYALRDIDKPWVYSQLKETVLENARGHFIVSREGLSDAISAVSMLNWEEIEIFLTLTKDSLKVHDSNGKNSYTVALDSFELPEGVEEVTLTFARNVFNKALLPMVSDHVTVGFADAESPVYLMNAHMGDSDEFEYSDEESFSIAVPVIK